MDREKKIFCKGDFIMKQLKKVLMGCLLILVLSSVTACGNNDNTDNNTDNDTTNDVTNGKIGRAHV